MNNEVQANAAHRRRLVLPSVRSGSPSSDVGMRNKQTKKSASADSAGLERPPLDPFLVAAVADQAVEIVDARFQRLLANPETYRMFQGFKRLLILQRIKRNLEISLANWPTKKTAEQKEREAREQARRTCVQPTLFDDF